MPAIPWTGHVHVERLLRDLDDAPQRGRLGLAVMQLSEPLRRFFGVTDATGMLVAEVAPESPAGRAKIAVGDVLVQVDGDAIASGEQVGAALRDRGSGEKIDVVVVRKKKRKTIRVTLDDVAPRDDGGWSERSEPAELDTLRRRVDELEAKIDHMQRPRSRR